MHNLNSLLVLNILWSLIILQLGMMVFGIGHLRKPGGRTYYGESGSLVAHDYVLTTADINKYSSPEKMKVYIGLSLLEPGKEDQVYFAVDKIYIHPIYEAFKIDRFNIALLHLNRTTKNEEESKPVEIDHKNWPKNVERPCTIAGYGKDSKSFTPGTLRGGVVNAVYGDKSCACPNEETKFGAGMICLVAEASYRICGGDFGGPLVCDGFLVGVAHEVQLCENFPENFEKCGHQLTRDAYIYVTPFAEWINHTMTTSSEMERRKSSQIVSSGSGSKRELQNSFLLKIFLIPIILMK